MCIEASELEELPLDDFDISLLESNFEQNVEVLVPNDEDDPDNLLDDEPEPDQDLPPGNQLDFDEILSAFEPNETVNFPENFNVSLFLKIVMENCQVDPEWDTTDKLCMKETSIYENLKNEPRFVQFLKVQWGHLVSSLKEKAMGKTDPYEQKELTAFCSAVFCFVRQQVMLFLISLHH